MKEIKQKNKLDNRSYGMFTFVEENNGIIGIRTDLGYEIQLDGKHIGYIYSSIMEHGIFVEYVELDSEQQGKHYFRQVLKEYMDFVHVRELYFDCGDDLLSMYQHIGSHIIGYDDFIEMYHMKLEYIEL